VQRQKGFQAFRVVSMDESTAVHPAQMLPPRTHVTSPRPAAGRAQVNGSTAARLRLRHLRRAHHDIFVHMETLPATA